MAHPHLDALLDHLFPFAQQVLEKHGEFYPFGAAITSSGEVKLVSSDIGTEHPDSQSVIDALVNGFRQEAAIGAVRAIGVCLDVLAIPPGGSQKLDAICARLEHESGEAVDVYLPYQKARFGKRVSYREIFATPGQRSVFGVS